MQNDARMRPEKPTQASSGRSHRPNPQPCRPASLSSSSRRMARASASESCSRTRSSARRASWTSSSASERLWRKRRDSFAKRRRKPHFHGDVSDFLGLCDCHHSANDETPKCSLRFVRCAASTTGSNSPLESHL